MSIQPSEHTVDQRIPEIGGGLVHADGGGLPVIGKLAERQYELVATDLTQIAKRRNVA